MEEQSIAIGAKIVEKAEYRFALRPRPRGFVPVETILLISKRAGPQRDLMNQKSNATV